MLRNRRRRYINWMVYVKSAVCGWPAMTDTRSGPLSVEYFAAVSSVTAYVPGTSWTRYVLGPPHPANASAKRHAADAP